MPNIRIWTLESENDAQVVKCLANKLVTHLQLGNLSIQTSGPRAVPRKNRRGVSSSDVLRMAVQNYLKQDACVVFRYRQRRADVDAINDEQEPNSPDQSDHTGLFRTTALMTKYFSHKLFRNSKRGC